MGDTQSAQREGKNDAAAEESANVDDVQTEQHIEDKPLRNNGQISEINGTADSSMAELNGLCEDAIAAEVVLCPEKDAPEELKVEVVTPLEEELPVEADANEVEPIELIEMEAKQNDINDGFRKFFSNISLKLTVKRGSTDKADMAKHVPEEELDKPDDIKDTVNEITFETAEQNTDRNTTPELLDNDSTTYQTLTDVPSEDFVEKAAEETIETKEKEAAPKDADASTTSPENEDSDQDVTPEEESLLSPSHSDEKETTTPFKRFFTTGIFSGIRKKKKPREDEAAEKELVDLGKKMAAETTDQTVQDQQQDEEVIAPGVEGPTAERELESNEKEEILTAEATSSSGNEPVQASPLKKLLSSSSFKKISKKPRSRKSSDAKLSDSGEHNQLLSSTESAETKTTTETAAGEDGAWASFKRLMTPQKRMKRPSLNQEEEKSPASIDGAKHKEGEQILERSTEEGKKRKDSSVSWDAVLCGSGRRSQKTSDSEDETPHEENKQDSGAKLLPAGTSNEVPDDLTSSSKDTENPPEEDEGSAWKSFKKLVTPKRKAKDDDESKDNIQSDGEVAQDDSSFSIKKLLPGRKKRKSLEKQEHASSEEVGKEVASGDEDSETPAVVPLSEFDQDETELHVQTEADVESNVPKEADDKLHDEITEQVLAHDSPTAEAKEIQDNEAAVEKEAAPAPVTDEEPEDLTESISKHQQLSDIPEEGVITETTPVSVTEEAARDDTIAEDLIEITSEAVTAPEPVDITLADETEMVSAVSQLSESSKTSGNTTPVPAEYNVMNIEVLLQQVSESVSISPNAVPVSTEEPYSERVVCSISQQILQSSVTNQPKVLELHRRSDATAVITGLNTEAINAVNELEATAETETVSHLSEAFPTEIAAEVPTKELDNAEPAADEVGNVTVSELQGRIKALEIAEENQHVVESVSEVNEDMSIEQVREGEEEVALAKEVVKDQIEKDVPKTHSQEEESVVVSAEETEDAAVKEEIQILEDEEIETTENVSELAQTEDQPPSLADELKAVLASEECDVQSPEVPTYKDIPPLETETDKPNQTAQDLTKATDETTNEPQTDEAENFEVAKVSEITDVKEVAKVSEITDVKEVAKVSEITDVKEVAKVSEIIDVKEVAKVSEITDFREVPGSAEVTEVEDISEVTETKDVSEATEVPDVVHAAPSEPEENNAQVLKNEVSEDAHPPAEKVEEEPKKEPEPLPEANVDAPEPDDTQESEAAVAPTLDSEAAGSESLEEEIISDVTSTMETITAEAEQTSEVNAEPEELLKPEVSPPDVKDVTETDTEAPKSPCEAAHSVEESQALVEDAPQSEENENAAEEIESSAATQLDQDCKINEILPIDAQVEHEESVVEAANELHAVAAVHIPSVNEEPSCAQLLEKTICIEESPAPCVDTAEASSEPTSEVNVCVVQDNVEGENVSKLPSLEVKAAASDHAVVTQIATRSLKGVTAEKPNFSVPEPLMTKFSSETEFYDVIETTLPLLNNDISEIAEERSVVMMMRVPLVEFEENHRFQVHVMNVDITHAENSSEAAIEVGILEAKEVIDVCHETIQKVENLSATAKIEGEIVQDNVRMTVQDIIQHVKGDEPETIQSYAGTELSKSNAVKGTRMETVVEKQSDDSEIPTQQQVAEDHTQISDIPDITAGDATAEELAVKKLNKNMETQLQTTQNQIVTHSNSGLISSAGNVESPSSLSLEFKLNIQFGQAKVQAPASPLAERAEPVKQSDMFEAGIQAVEALEPEPQRNLTQTAEIVKQTEQHEVAVQATEVTEPDADIHSDQRAVIASMPMLQEVGIQAMGTIEPVEKVKSTKSAVTKVQASEITEPVRQKEKRAVIMSKPVLFVKNAEEDVQEIEEENDQDVWLDAEEDIFTQEEAQRYAHEAEESEELLTESEPEEEEEEEEGEEEEEEEDDEEEDDDEHELEMVSSPETDDNEYQQETQKTAGEIESEGEDFAVALEDLESSITSEDLD